MAASTLTVNGTSTTVVITSAQTTAAQIITFPDCPASDSVAYIATAQTLAAKTLTAPIINGATSASGNFDLSGSSGTFKTCAGANTISGVTTMAATKALNLAAGTATAGQAPIYFNTAGVNLTAAAAGAMEFDGVCFYTTPLASARGLSPSTMFSIVPAADFSLATTLGVQSAFPATGDVWTLAASTSYFFEGQYMITHTTTACTVALAFACSNAPTSIAYSTWAMVGAVNTTISTATAATANLTYINTVATTVVTASTTANFFIRFRGILRTNSATTVTPQVNWSANTSVPVMLHDSYITFTPTGTSTTNVLGNVG